MRKRKKKTALKQKLAKEYNAQEKLVLKIQNKLKRAKGENLGRLLRDMEEQIKKGQEMAKIIKAKKYKNLKINIGFFFQKRGGGKIRAGEDKETLELKKLYQYVVAEERDYKTYDNLPRKEQHKRLEVWNTNLERAKNLVRKGVKAKGIPRNFFNK